MNICRAPPLEPSVISLGVSFAAWTQTLGDASLTLFQCDSVALVLIYANRLVAAYFSAPDSGGGVVNLPRILQESMVR